MAATLSVECWIYSDRHFFLLRPLPGPGDANPPDGPLMGGIEDGETPGEAALRVLDDAGFDLADIDLTHVASDVEVLMPQGQAEHVEVYLAAWHRAAGHGLPPFSTRHDASSFVLPHQVPALLQRDRNHATWKLIREHQLAR